MSTLQVTTITTVNNTTPLILATGNTGGGQIVVQAANNDIQFNGNFRLTANITGDGSGLTLPTSNVANAAFGRANTALQNTTGTLAGTLTVSQSLSVGGTNPFGYKINANGASSVNTNWVGSTNPLGTAGIGAGFIATIDAGNYGYLYQSGAGNFYLTNSNTTGGLYLTTGGDYRLSITSGGNVGVGTTSPLYKLHVYTPSSYASATSAYFQGNSPNASGLYIQNDNSSAYGTIYSYGNTGYGVTNWANSFVIEAVPSTGGNLVLDAYTGSVVFQTGRSNRMIINSSGNVGIGTTSPGFKLHVEGETFLGRTDSSTEGGQLSFARSSDNSLLYAIDVNGSGSSPEFRLLNQAGGTVFFSAAPAGVNYIKFNPTQMAIGDANVLDDYEEGTWTPRIDSNNGQGTFTTKVGYYIKIGRKVTAWFLCDNGNSLAAGTTQYLGGLPFSIYSSYSGTSCVGQMGTNGPATRTQQLMTLSANRGVAYVYIGGTQETTTITYASGVLEYLTDN